MCEIVFDLYDSYGDGWSGNYLVVDYGNGNSEQLTIENGSSASFSRVVDTDSHITLTWISGSYIDECSFDVRFVNGVLIYHESGLNASFQQELTINCSLATAPRTITAVADPEEGGTIEGAGTYDGGTVITLTAIPSEGYDFCYWEENSQQVSTEVNYTFLVETDRNLVARFSMPLTVSITTNLPEGGTTTGGGVYYYGNTCTLMAIPNEGFLFLNWSKNGEVVGFYDTYSFTVTEDVEIVAVFMHLDGKLIGQGEATNQYLPSFSYYYYTLSQQIYTPEEIVEAGNITSISYYNGGATKTRTYDIYMVHTDKLAFDNNTDWITVSEADRVYSGSVTMTKGYWTTIVLDAPFTYNGTSNLAIVVDDNSGNYTGSPHMTCRTFNGNGNQAIRVYSDGTNYDPYNPSSYGGTLHSVKNQIIIGFMDKETQSADLMRGWTWWSPTVQTSIDFIETALGDTLQLIQANDGTPVGDIVAGQMYKIQTTAPCTLAVTGVPITSATVTLNPGENWFGFVGTTKTVAAAFAGFTPAEGDKIVSQEDGFAIFEDGAWHGTLTTLIPGKGYVYISNATTTKTLVIGE